MTVSVECACGWTGSDWAEAKEHVLVAGVVHGHEVRPLTWRRETYKPHPRPAGETEELIRQSIRGASKTPDQAHPRHPSGAE